jgi:hypothetical protein
MSKILKNNTGSPITITDVGGVIIAASPGTYTIPPQDYLLWAQSSDIITYLNDASPTPSITVNDGSVDLNPSDGMDLIKGLFPRLFVFDPIVENVAITLASTEVTHALPTGTKRFLIKLRGLAILKLSYAVGTSGTVFSTIHPGTFYSESRIGAASTTLYFQSPAASQTAEITSWS